MTNLQLLRKTKGMSQKHLAQTLRMRLCDVSKLENNWFKRVPERIETELKNLFGMEWTFDALMENAAPPIPPETHQQSAQGEKRAAA